MAEIQARDPSVTNRALSCWGLRLFERFNSLYFGGRIPPYRVSVRGRVPGLDGEGIHLRGRRLIALQRTDENLMISTLVHEMAHAASNDWHGPRWRAEMERLRLAGAPIEEHDLQPPGRLTRSMVMASTEEALAIRPGLTMAELAETLVCEHGGAPSGKALLRSYPWIRVAFRDAQLEAGRFAPEFAG